jgi:hypothetical protein
MAPAQVLIFGLNLTPFTALPSEEESAKEAEAQNQQDLHTQGGWFLLAEE